MRRLSRKVLLIAAAAIASGLFLRLAFPPFDGKGAGVVWVAPIPVFLAARLLRPRRAALFGFLWGFAFWVSALTWFVPVAVVAAWLSVASVVPVTMVSVVP